MFEVRSYHYDPSQFEAYRKWAVEEAVPCLKANLDIVGFWLDSGEPGELTGADPDANKHGIANVTWILRWDSKEARDEAFKTFFGGDVWQAVWAKHPDPDGYLQMEARFTEAV